VRVSSLRKFLSVAFVAQAAILVGCGQGNAPTVSAPERGANQLPTIMANGREYTLGFDDKRFKQVDKKVKPTKLNRQGLLPTKMDLAETCSPVANQGKLGSCTAFAVGKGFREFQLNRQKEEFKPLSALFIYYEARKMAGNETEATGSTITDNMTVLARTGIATESIFPYDVLKFAIEPPQAAYEAAKEYKYTNGIRIHGLEDAQVALSKGEAVVFAYDVMESFRSIKSDGLMPMPKAGEKRLGGHAVMAVGYDNQKQVVKVRNSWGADWADGGYFYMPYEYFKTNARDVWTADFRTEN
jgi:C1A family cysteine protease